MYSELMSLYNFVIIDHAWNSLNYVDERIVYESYQIACKGGIVYV